MLDKPKYLLLNYSRIIIVTHLYLSIINQISKNKLPPILALLILTVTCVVVYSYKYSPYLTPFNLPETNSGK